MATVKVTEILNHGKYYKMNNLIDIVLECPECHEVCGFPYVGAFKVVSVPLYKGGEFNVICKFCHCEFSIEIVN